MENREDERGKQRGRDRPSVIVRARTDQQYDRCQRVERPPPWRLKEKRVLSLSSDVNTPVDSRVH